MTLACWIWINWTMLTTVAFVWHLLHLLSREIWLPNVKLTFYQVHCSCQISPALLLCQKNWFCGKARLENFYTLLHSKSFMSIHIGVKRISQVCCLVHLRNMKKNYKTQLWVEKQNRVLFWTTLYVRWNRIKNHAQKRWLIEEKEVRNWLK